jgi:cold shock CspA family protein
MKDQMPNILPSGRGSFSKEGAAPEPGGTRYGNLGSGYHTTVYEGLAINTGGRFIRVAVRGNQMLNRVCVPHDVVFGGEKIAVGDSLLVGGIKMTGQEPEATMAWPFRANGSNGHQAGKPINPRPLPPRPPRLARHVGTVSRIHPSGKFGEILEDRTGHRFFAHQSQFENGARMMAGFRVSFTAAKTERGAAALDIKPN